MNILGINGLGISPSACLVQNGKLVAMAEEERFNRYKGSYGFMPEKAVKFCLEFANLKLKDVDYISFGWDANKYNFYMLYYFFVTYLKYAPKFQSSSNILKIIEMILKYNPNNIKMQLKEMFHNIGITDDLPEIIFVPHHMCHAASSFYTSGFDKSYIIVIDGSGEDYCTTIMKGEGLKISIVKKIKIPNSIGWFYQSITEFLGFKPNSQEGKVMALASYGQEDEEIFNKINKIISYEKGKLFYRYNAKYSFLGRHNYGNVFSDEMIKLLGLPREHNEEIVNIHKNIAYCSQKIVEDIIVNIIENISKYKDYNKKICISGGVGLNCKLNGKIAELDSVEELFVPPFPNDVGTAFGAAMFVSIKKGYDPRFKMEHSYFGPSYSCNEIENVLIKNSIKFKKVNEIEKVVSELIFNDKIVGWFQGRMEVGPRALGNRSILANPTKEWVSEYINKKIKNREIWRPFAPSILYEKRYDFVESFQESPFMAIAFKVPDKVKLKIPAVVHVDNTMRPHFVKKNVNPKFWNLINYFGKKSGTYAVLNTSFNDNEEPIVCSPKDALKTFYSSGLDYLAIEDFLVYK